MLEHCGDAKLVAAPTRVVVVTPSYNDWESLAVLVGELERQAERHRFTLTVLAVDDGSDLQAPADLRATVLPLTCNLGHQRAIAIGLAYAYLNMEFDVVVVMDADGEDKPEHLSLMLEEHARHPESLIVATRSQRSEGSTFRMFYGLYKLVFRLLIGRAITFGNFALIPRGRLGRLLMMPELWNHLAATYLRSRIALRPLGLARGTRYAGRSKMNMPALVTHGLSAISVFSDIMVARLLLASCALFVTSIVGVGIVVGIRLLTTLAIAGWATSAVGILVVISMQALMMSLMSAFLLLSGRAQIPVSLIQEHGRFVRS